MYTLNENDKENAPLLFEIAPTEANISWRKDAALVRELYRTHRIETQTLLMQGCRTGSAEFASLAKRRKQ